MEGALRSPGRPLDPGVRGAMETRFAYDFSRVRVHSDERAAASAQALGANAYTFGAHIVAERDHLQRDPRLLAHELAHVVQRGARAPSPPTRLSAPGDAAELQADAAAEAVARGAPRVGMPSGAGGDATLLCQRPRAPNPPDRNLLNSPPAPASPMSRADFESIMRTRYGVTRIATGTQEEQTRRSTPMGGAPPGGIVLPNWQSWDPGATSPVYQSIIDSIEDFENSVGGYPAITEILFFRVLYEVNAQGVGVPNPNVGASFGAGQLTIYRGTTTLDKGLPTGRSTAAGNYPQVFATLTNPAQTPGAPVPLPTPTQSVRRIITHELGHGLAEAAMNVDPQTFSDYRRAVGWTAQQPPQLFDAGAPGVQQAIAAGTPPPPQFEITATTWNSSQWVEQPLSDYMVAGGPGEDFAEAVMAYVQEPNLLVARSPRRFRFLDQRRERWLRQLIQRPQIGDFPEPDPLRRPV